MGTKYSTHQRFATRCTRPRRRTCSSGRNQKRSGGVPHAARGLDLFTQFGCVKRNADADTSGVETPGGEAFLFFLRMWFRRAPVLFGNDELDRFVALAVGRVVAVADADQPLAVFRDQSLGALLPGAANGADFHGDPSLVGFRCASAYAGVCRDGKTRSAVEGSQMSGVATVHPRGGSRSRNSADSRGRRAAPPGWSRPSASRCRR